NAHHARMPPMPVRLLVPGVTLIDDGIDGDSSFAGLTVANNQFALTAANRHHGVDGLQPRLQRLVYRQAIDHAWGDALNRTALCRINGTLAVNRLPQGIHHAPDHRLADRDLHDASGAPDFIALFNLRIRAEEHGPDVVLFQVEGHTINVMWELQEFPGQAFFQTIDAGDTVAHGNHRADLSEFGLADIAFNLALDDFADFCCSNLCHGTSPPYQGFAHRGQLPSHTPIHNDIVDPHHHPANDGGIHMGFELHVLLGRSGNLLGHVLALLRIHLDRCRDLGHHTAEFVAGHTLVLRADG